MFLRITFVLCLLFASLAVAQDPWLDTLSYTGGGYWRVRVPLVFANAGETPLEGAPVAVAIAATDGTSALTGATVASLRVAMADGTELVFDIQNAQGAPKRSGAIAEGDVVYVPLEAAPDSVVTLYLYADNAAAWLPPEWLHADLANPGFEEGAAAPAGWQTIAADSMHRMSLDRTVVHTGAVSARCDVDLGAAPAWVKYAQGSYSVSPGQQYRFTGWAKAEKIDGRAGWYIHVHGKGRLLVNKNDCRTGPSTGGSPASSLPCRKAAKPSPAGRCCMGRARRGSMTRGSNCSTAPRCRSRK